MVCAISTDDVDRAIKTIESSRATHVGWAEWFERHPSEEAKHKGLIHTATEQRTIIADYDHVLTCLDALRQLTAAANRDVA